MPASAYTRAKQPEQVRRALLDRAAAIAMDHGVSGVTVQAVAAAAGVTKGGLFHHFGSKQALIEGLFADLLARVDAEIDAAIEADPKPRGSFTRAYVNAVFTGFNVTVKHRRIGRDAVAVDFFGKLQPSFARSLVSANLAARRLA